MMSLNFLANGSKDILVRYKATERQLIKFYTKCSLLEQMGCVLFPVMYWRMSNLYDHIIIMDGTLYDDRISLYNSN